MKFNLDPKPQICRHRYQEVKKNPKGTDYCLASLSRFPLPSIVPFFLPFINTYQRPYSGSGSLQALGNSKMTKTQFSLGAQRPEGKQRLSSFQANELMPTTGAMGAERKVSQLCLDRYRGKVWSLGEGVCAPLLWLLVSVVDTLSCLPKNYFPPSFSPSNPNSIWGCLCVRLQH